MAKVLVLGARGMLGRRVVEAFSRHEVVATSRVAGVGVSALDVTDRRAVQDAVEGLRPQWIVNAAAYTAVDRAETEAEAARNLNASAPEIVAGAAKRVGAIFLHISTDFVFGGDEPGERVETDPVAPIGVYAKTKEEGERRVRSLTPDHIILRIAWLFGADGKNFVDTMLRLGRERERLRVVHDQRGTPTFTNDAAALCVRLLEAGLRGTIHGANRNPTTWYEFAREALRLARIPTPIDPITSAEYPTPAVRPKNSALRNQVLESTIGNTMRPWTEALAEYLRSR